MNSSPSPEAESTLTRLFARLPKPVAKAGACATSLIAGIAVAIVLHYVLYRIGLPSKPFIYVAF
jgi:hypothetical protein